jgi:hypothetical protein
MLYPLDLPCSPATAQERKESGAVTQLYPANIDLESGDVNLQDVCAVEWAAYKQALDTVIDLDPVRLTMAGGSHPVARLDEAAVALFCAGWHAAVRATQAAGAGSGFAVPVTCCPRCGGEGRLWDGKWIRRTRAKQHRHAPRGRERATTAPARG